MTPAALRTELQRLGLTQAGASRVLEVETRTMRRWMDPTDERDAPRAVELALRKMTPTEAAKLAKAPS